MKSNETLAGQKGPQGTPKASAEPGKKMPAPPRASDSPAERVAKSRESVQEAKQKAADARSKGQESKAKAEEARAKAAEAREKAEDAQAKVQEAKAKVQEARTQGTKEKSQFFDITYQKAAQERAGHLQEQSLHDRERAASAKDHLGKLKEKLKTSPGDSKTQGEAIAALRDAQVAVAEQLRTAAEREGVALEIAGARVALEIKGARGVAVPDVPVIAVGDTQRTAGNVYAEQAENDASGLDFLARTIEAQGVDYELGAQDYESKKLQLQDTMEKLKSKYVDLKVNHSKRSCDVQASALQSVAERLGDSAAREKLSKVQEKCSQIRDEKGAESTTKETENELQGIRQGLKNSLAAAVKAGTTLVRPTFSPTNETASIPSLSTPTPILTLPVNATLASPGPFISSTTNLKVTGMEISQGMQNLNNDMPLVDGRRTIVRVYVKNSGLSTSVSGVNARLYGHRGFGSSALSGSPLEAENNPVTVKRDGGNRVNLDDSFWFVLPEEWLTSSLFLVAEVNYDDNVTESDKTDNGVTKLVTFNRVKTLNMTLVPLHIHPNGDSSQGVKTFWGTENYRWDIYNNLYRLHPIADLDVWRFETTLKPNDHDDGSEWNIGEEEGGDDMLLAIYVHNYYTDDEAWYMRYVGGVHKDLSAAWSGLAYRTHLDSWVKMKTDHGGHPKWFHEGGSTLGHELGHNAGRKHAECTGTEAEGGAVDSSYPYPYPDCQLARVDPEGYYGLDVYYAKFDDLDKPMVISNDPGAATTYRGYPMMGYQEPQYIDPYTYCALLNSYQPIEDYIATRELICNLSFSPPVGPTPLPAADSARLRELRGAPRLVAVGGLLNLEKSTGRLTEVHLQKAGDVFADNKAQAEKRLQHLAAGEGSSFSLEVQDSKGKALYSQPVLLDTHKHGKPRRSGFLEILPWPSEAAQVALKAGDRTLATRSTSASAPTVTLLSPNGGEKLGRDATIRWKASDPDGDSLRFHILYSTDGGLKWKAIARNVQGTEYKTSGSEFVPGAAKAKFRVVASDGFHTAHDDSDGTFTVSGSAPSAVIHSPKDGKTFLGKRALLLDGSAEDPEDGGLKGRSLVWTSDKAGVLGYGSEVRVNLSKLDSGKHLITLTATDSDGMKGTASVTVTVGAVGSRGSVAIAGSGQK